MSGSAVGEASPEDMKADKLINKQLRADQKKSKRELKLLLLGAGESGKSTFFKQMKILYKKGFSETERMDFKDAIQSNTIQSMKILINACEKFNLPITGDLKETADRVMGHTFSSAEFPDQVRDDIAALWKCEAIQGAYEQRAKFQLTDSANYYFDHLDRVSKQDFIPDVEDLLRARIRTTGIVEANFELKGTNLRMFDVGGQRNERRKWIHCFEDCDAVIFFVALSEYDQTLYEDDKTNRMKESLVLFDEICNSRWFEDTNIILFLNKMDLFKEKIAKTDLNVCFPEYTGGCDFDKAHRFIEKKFKDLNRNKSGKNVYTHLTCATDTKQIGKVMDDLQDKILRDNLKMMGM